MVFAFCNERRYALEDSGADLCDGASPTSMGFQRSSGASGRARAARVCNPTVFIPRRSSSAPSRAVHKVRKEAEDQ